jgi:hypothetical protein
MYVSKADKTGTYKWVKVPTNNKTKKNVENKATIEDLRDMAKRYRVTISGSKKQVAERLFMMTHRGRTMNRKDFKKIEPLISNKFLRYLKKYNM